MGKFSKLTNTVDCHVQHLSWPHDGEQAVNAFKNSDHHLVLIFRGRFVFWMCTRVYNTVHVEVQVVELYVIRIR